MKKSISTLQENKMLKKVILFLPVFLLGLAISAQPTYINVTGCSTSSINGNYKLSTGNYNCVSCDGYDQITLPSEAPTGTVLYRETFTNTQWHASTSGFGTCFSFNLVVLTGAGVSCDPTAATNAGTCVVTSGLLPVELVAFQAEERNENIHLSWSTASEINNEGFDSLSGDEQERLYKGSQSLSQNKKKD